MNAPCLWKSAILAFAVVALCAPAWALPQDDLEKIVVFGTSVSDPGNAFALYGGTNNPPYDTLDWTRIPACDDAYARGGHHLSNGATWIEQLGRPMGLAQVVGPAFRAPHDRATNYAVCGARSHEGGTTINLPEQVAAFLNDFGGAAPPDALYVLEFGPNDIRDALNSPPEAGAIIAAAVTEIGNQVVALYGAGARTFLITRAPDVGLTPALRIVDKVSPGAANAATQLSGLFNLALDGVVASLEGLPGIEIKRLDLFTILNNVVADPEAYGMVVVDTTCVTPNVPPFECQNPDEYMFWDGIHPTAAGHALLRYEAAVALGLE